MQCFQTNENHWGIKTPYKRCPFPESWRGLHEKELAAVSGVAGGVKVVELRTGQKLVEVGPASVPVRVVRFSPDGKLLVTGHDTGTVQVGDHHHPGVGWGVITVFSAWFLLLIICCLVSFLSAC